MNLARSRQFDVNTNPVISAIEIVTRSVPERAVSPVWFLRRPSALDRRFIASAHIASEIEPDGEFQKVTINNQVYFWPARASLSELLQIVSEQNVPNHPHRYLWGPTQIRAGDVVIDIGACEGSFSAIAAALGARVIAVEPSLLMAKAMRTLFAARQLPPPVIADCLLGPADASLYFRDNPENPGRSRIETEPSSSNREVPVKTLDGLVDSLSLSKLDFIKCDAEGSDVGIIKGGEKTLRRFRPRLAICTYHKESDYLDLFCYLQPFGYKLRGKGFLRTHGKYRVFMLHAWAHSDAS